MTSFPHTKAFDNLVKPWRPVVGTSLLLLLTLMGKVQGQDFSYATNNGTITIAGYLGSGGAVTIPDTTNGLPVTSIGDYAFMGNTNVTSVTIPYSVRSIGFATFYECSSLTSVIIPTGVTSIGMGTFEYCSSLTNVTIPSSVTSIGTYAFEFDTSLINVSIPNSVTNIGEYAFANCTSLMGVYFKGNASLNWNVLLGGDTNATVYYLPGTTGWSTTFGGRPTMLWNPQVQTTDGGFGVVQNQFGFNITGTPSIPLVVEASVDLSAASWIPLQNCTLTNGLLYFSDPQWKNYSERFYRIRSP